VKYSILITIGETKTLIVKSKHISTVHGDCHHGLF